MFCAPLTAFDQTWVHLDATAAVDGHPTSSFLAGQFHELVKVGIVPCGIELPARFLLQQPLPFGFKLDEEVSDVSL